jgi:hypothetical protein
MKNLYLSVLLITLSASAYSQLNNGGFHANFGIDADTRAGYTKYGPPAPSPSGDDWFSPSGNSGKGVIDTSNAAYFKSKLQSNKNICFVKNMSTPLFSQVNNKLWLDAIYIRDYTAASGKDSTAFLGSNKNGDNPLTWDGGASSVASKCDIIDAYSHFRRNGVNITDSLWLFAGLSTYGTNGTRYADIELYKKEISFNPATGNFNSAGLSNGHTEWLFDPFGNIIQTGDLIIALSFQGGGAPIIDVRIWVNRLTYLTVNPNLFKFGNNFDGGAVWGYANIVANNGSTAFGSGICNSSNSATNDTTYSTPWGSMNTSGAWSANYQSLQFVEVGLNFTRMGIDPMLYGNMNLACDRIFHSIFYKSRSSTSFTSNMQDFAGPLNFSQPGLGAINARTDTLKCNHPMGTLVVSNPTTVGHYNWTTLNGNIVSSNSDSSVINVNKTGIYTLAASMTAGCPAISTQNLYVPVDSLPPVASADITMTPAGDLQLVGGDPLLSNVLTPMGPSQGLSWNWTGPNGFTSTLQNPLINLDWAWGSYYLTVTELRNGCTAMASLDVSFKAPIKDPGGIAAKNAAGYNDVAGKLSGQTYLWRNTSTDKLYLVTEQKENISASIAIYNTNGQLLNMKKLQFVKGENNIELPLQSSNQVRIVSVYTGNRLLFVRKVLF